MRRGVLVITVMVASVAGPARATNPAPPDGGGKRAKVYVALGDSYSSGVGTRDYSWNGPCSRGPYAYPALIAARKGWDLRFRACGGATTQDVLDTQMTSVTRKARFVSITIGGNDAGFSHVIRQCAKPWPTTCWGDIDKAEDFIRHELPGRLDRVYRAIRDRTPRANRLAVGYPRIFNGEQCNGGARISPGEQSRLNEAADLLDSVIRDRAYVDGFRWIDVRNDFIGHAVCDDVEWINGLSNPTSDSYHPNRAGHRALKRLVLPMLTA